METCHIGIYVCMPRRRGGGPGRDTSVAHARPPFRAAWQKGRGEIGRA